MIVAIPVGPFEWLDEAVNTINHVRGMMEKGDELVLMLDKYTSLPSGFLTWIVRRADHVIVSRFPFGSGDVRNRAFEYALSKRDCILIMDAHVTYTGDIHRLCDAKMAVPWRTWARVRDRVVGYNVYAGPAYNPGHWFQIFESIEFFVYDNPVYSVSPEAIEAVKDYLPYFPPFFLREISAVVLSIYRLTGIMTKPIAGVEAVHRYRPVDKEPRDERRVLCIGHSLCDVPNPYGTAAMVNLAMYRVLHYGDEYEVPFKDKLKEMNRQFKDDLRELYQRYSRYLK